jgi:P pilus assembly chaperone PapD
MRKLSMLVLVAALATSATASAAVTTAPSRLPFVQDDFARAKSAARQRGLPIFVEVWAPW